MRRRYMSRDRRTLSNCCIVSCIGYSSLGLKWLTLITQALLSIQIFVGTNTRVIFTYKLLGNSQLHASQYPYCFYLQSINLLLSSWDYNLIMQKQGSKRVHSIQYTQQPKVGASAYLVNNSFYSIMQPKRASFDIKLYMQLHRKLIRKSMIEKKFEQSLYHFNNQVNNARKGFKGQLRPDLYLTKSISCRQRRTYAQVNAWHKADQFETQNDQKTSQPKQFQEERSRFSTLQSSHQKPNLMYNLSLYRKTYKKPDMKNAKICLSVIKNIRQTKEDEKRKVSITADFTEIRTKRMSNAF